MRFSYCMLPDYPLDESIDMIKTADELGFYACYSVDETWHKDLWVLFAAAARETKHIRFGPNVTHVFLREPTLICQQMATLDELTGGRTEIVVSTGNFGLLSQYKIDWARQKPLSRLKEAIHVMRTFLDEGAITFEGDFFKYSGLYTFARPGPGAHPDQDGRDEGPALVPDGGRDRRRHAPGARLLARGLRLHGRAPPDRRREGRARLTELDNGAWVVTVVSEDSAAAKRAARILVAFYISSMPEEQLARHGIDASELAPVVEALGAGDVPKAVSCSSRTTPRSSRVAGTPEEVVEKIKTDIEPAGVNHMILSLADPALVKLFCGEDVPNVPDISGQLKLVAERVMPAFEPALR